MTAHPGKDAMHPELKTRPIEPLLLRVEEAAVLLGVSRRTVATLASSGKLTPIHPVGMRMRRFARIELLALVEQWLDEARSEGSHG